MDNDRSQFKKIDTGNGLSSDLAATTNDRLELTVIELQHLQKNNTDQTEKLSASINKLEGTIRELDLKNSRQQTFNTRIGIIAIIFAVLSVIQVIDILVRGIGK